jgi:hypothetical protein
MNPPPPPKAKKNAKAWVPPPPPPKAKNNPAKKKENPPPLKLAYEMTKEELNEHMKKEVQEQFVPRKSKPKQPVNPAGQKFFVTIYQLREKETLSDYDCSIAKSYQKKSNCRVKIIPQLGEQPQQSIPPLQVLSKEDEATAEFVVETKLTKAQLRGEVPIPIHPGAGKKTICNGEPLMWPELLNMLPTRMRELHEWYMRATADGDVMFAARVKDSNLHQGLADVWIEFESLWFLYHQDALNKSLVSVFLM